MVVKRNLSQATLLASLIGDPFHWDLLMGYVAVEKARIVSQLLSCNESELKSLQGEMKTLNKLAGLEATLKTERSTQKQ